MMHDGGFHHEDQVASYLQNKEQGNVDGRLPVGALQSIQIISGTLRPNGPYRAQSPSLDSFDRLAVVRFGGADITHHP